MALEKKYGFEMTADIARIKGGWGFKNLSTQFLRNTVKPGSGKRLWHNHPDGKQFSGYQDVAGDYQGDIAVALYPKGRAPTMYVSTSSNSMLKFDPRDVFADQKGMTVDQATEHRNGVISNKGEGYVQEFRF